MQWEYKMLNIGPVNKQPVQPPVQSSGSSQPVKKVNQGSKAFKFLNF